ncbi:MAG: nitrogenase-stabilizing/protective protein NifW [Rhodospirillales bacterium]|nr:nitrogenase-stabilizing/protective protein NifW [Rhodospirillales bacterium]
MTRLMDTLKSLETAEDFLDCFEIPYEQRVIDVNRLHILQRLHDRLAQSDLESMDDAQLRETMSTFLAAAYHDFVVSDARTEKVFKVFHRHDGAARSPEKTIIPLADVRGATEREDP